MSAAITEEKIEEFVAARFQALDQHRPLEEVCGFLADSDLEMVFLEKTVCNLDDFEAWYPGVTGKSFDEMHGVVSIDSKINGDHPE